MKTEKTEIEKGIQMIDFNRPALTGKEFDYIRDAAQRGKLCGDGEYTKRCSRWMEKNFHVKHVMLPHPVHMPWKWQHIFQISSLEMR